MKRITESEITPWQKACLEAAAQIGIPLVDDLNDLDQDVGMSTSPVNIVNGIRWNTAFAYLDPVRASGRLTVMGQTIVDRLHLDKGRVTAFEVLGPEGGVTIEARQVVLCAGTYGSPSILLRSGIGPAEELRALGIEPNSEIARQRPADTRRSNRRAQN